MSKNENKTMSLRVLESDIVELTLDYKHTFAVWRALECYVDVCQVAQEHLNDAGMRTDEQGMKPLIDVRDLLRAHMRKALGYRRDDDPIEGGA